MSSQSSGLSTSVIEFGFLCVNYREARLTEGRLTASPKRPGDGYSKSLLQKHFRLWVLGGVYLQVFRNPQFANIFIAYKFPKKESKSI